MDEDVVEDPAQSSEPDISMYLLQPEVVPDIKENMINDDNSQIEDLFLADTPDLVEAVAMDHGDMDMDMEMADCPLAAAMAAETAALEEGDMDMDMDHGDMDMDMEAGCPIAAAMAAEAVALEEGSEDIADIE